MNKHNCSSKTLSTKTGTGWMWPMGFSMPTPSLDIYSSIVSSAYNSLLSIIAGIATLSTHCSLWHKFIVPSRSSIGTSWIYFRQQTSRLLAISWSAQAGRTKYHWLSGWKQTFISHNSGDGEVCYQGARCWWPLLSRCQSSRWLPRCLTWLSESTSELWCLFLFL